MNVRNRRIYQAVTVLTFSLSATFSTAQSFKVVAWTTSVTPANKPGSAVIHVKGAVDEGWHVYALDQLPNGPTALKISVDPNPVADSAGTPIGSKSARAHDASFNLDTSYYTNQFEVSVPVKLSHAGSGNGAHIPLSIRFQACSDRTCLPPKTVHLDVALTAL